MVKRTNKSHLCSIGLCPLLGRCPASSHSDSYLCKAEQWVSLTTYCPLVTCFGLKSALSKLKSVSIQPSKKTFRVSFLLSSLISICLNSTLKKKTFSGLYSALIPDPVTVLQSIKSILKCAFPGRLEIHPRVLQDVSPLGPLPCSHSTASADHSKQGIGYR